MWGGACFWPRPSYFRDMDEKQFKQEVRDKSVQYSYSIEGLGRVHIRQTGAYITGIKVDNTVEYAFDGAQVLQSDYIIKTGVEIMKYVSGETFNIAVPNVMFAEGGDEEVVAAVMQVPYGEKTDVKVVAKSAKTFGRIASGLCMDIIVPFHRVVWKDEPGHHKVLRAIEQINYDRYLGMLCLFGAMPSEAAMEDGRACPTNTTIPKNYR